MILLRLKITTHEDKPPPNIPQLGEDSAPGGDYKTLYKIKRKTEDVKRGYHGSEERLKRFDSVLVK